MSRAVGLGAKAPSEPHCCTSIRAEARLAGRFRVVDDRPSERIIDQRVRNRAVEAVEVLAEGDDGVRKVGSVDYVNYFFDLIDDDVSPAWRDLSTYDPAEVAELEKVQSLLLDACAATPEICTSDEFIASAWPERIKPVAADTLALMLSRGRFREDREEDSPSA